MRITQKTIWDYDEFLTGICEAAKDDDLDFVLLLIAAMADVFTLSGTVVTEITKQPVLLFCLAAGLVPVGIGIFARLKNAAR